MPQSVSDTLLDGVVDAITALNLSLESSASNGGVASVQKRKVPRAGESPNPILPLIIVSPSFRQGRDVRWDTGGVNGRHLREYVFDVTIIAPGNRDNLTNLDYLQEWRIQIARLFAQPRSLDVDELMDTYVDPTSVLDRDAARKSYDYSTLTIRFECVEEA